MNSPVLKIQIISSELSSFLDIFENKIKKDLYEKPLRLTILLGFLLLGLAPLSCETAIKAFGKYQQKEELQVKSILEEANFALAEEKPQSALIKYQKALKLDKKNPQTNFELAAFYIIQNQPALAKPYIKVLEKSKNTNSYVQALNGLISFNKANYPKAETLLQTAYKKGLNQDWLIDSLGASLLANKKEKQAFKLAGWPKDCQINALAHADCMNRLANWHSKIIGHKIEEQNLFHQKRQLIFLGESLRSLMLGLKEVDGNFRLQLIQKYQTQRKKLTLSYAEYSLKLHLSKQKLSLGDLTKGEKQIQPI